MFEDLSPEELEAEKKAEVAKTRALIGEEALAKELNKFTDEEKQAFLASGMSIEDFLLSRLTVERLLREIEDDFIDLLTLMILSS